MVSKPYQWKDGATLEEHSRRKHKILREYFRRYLLERCKNPNSRRFRLAVVDGFSGGGIYSDGSAGSPLIFLDTLLSTVSEINLRRASEGMPKVEVDCLLLLNDKNREAVDQLPELLAPLIARSKEASSNTSLTVEYSNGEFEQIIPSLQDRIETGRYRSILYNLDQCGHTHVSRATISGLMNSGRSVEVFLTYAIQAQMTFLEQSNPAAVSRALSALDLAPGALALSDGLLTKRNWLGVMEGLVFDQFRQCAPFVAPFSIHNPEGWRYWFMHFANSYRAREVYNEVQHDNSSAQAHFGRAGLRMLTYNPEDEKGSLYLFDADARAEARNQLPEDIARLVSDGGDTIEISDFYSSIYNETPAHSDDIRQAIFDHDDLEIITPTGNDRRFPHTISLNDTLRLKKQLRFYLPFPTNRK